MSLSKTRLHFSRAMYRGASSAAGLGAQIAPDLEQALSTLPAGEDLDVAALFRFLSGVLGRVAAGTSNDQAMMRVNHRLDNCRQDLEAARAELRADLLALKKIAEVAFGKEQGRAFLLLPARLENEAPILAQRARAAVAQLRKDQALPAYQIPLDLDREAWARTLEKKQMAVEAADRTLLEQHKRVIEVRDGQHRNLATLERQGRAAWLMLKGLYLFADKPELIKDLERGPRVRSRTVDGAEREVEAEPAIEKEQPVIVEVASGPSSGPRLMAKENPALPQTRLIDRHQTEPAEDPRINRQGPGGQPFRQQPIGVDARASRKEVHPNDGLSA